MDRALKLAPRRGGVCVALLAACIELPAVAPEGFACVKDDQAGCPESHACVDDACVPRLACFEADELELGCDPTRNRCDLLVGESFARVACKSGTHLVSTATTPKDPETCGCEDGAVCVTLARFEPEWPLYALTPSERSADERLRQAGLSEVAETRACVLPCGSERDCPGNHTCRATAVVGIEGARGTVGTCYPDRLPTTSSVATAQLDPQHCDAAADCTHELGREVGRCRVDALVVGDHPDRPVGRGWGDRLALTARCVSDSGAGLKEAGVGCLDSAQCRSGACVEGRCAILCSPWSSDPCPGQRQCTGELVERGTEAEPIIDRIFVCGR
ncbi:MAG: hypothetical protein HYV07_20045 [Deltaproteobacteria bacterium]|nr:hypothetical protein [Deltaproteobacteria bacterium]